MIKRLVDIVISLLLLSLSVPIVLPVLFLVWREDGDSPFYVAPRVGKGGKVFRMIKIRSMVKKADATGADSTAGDDPRITSVGKFVRRYKLDEIPQLINVLKGEMSIVGPRPNVPREVALYTDEERRLLSVRSGITDFASIVFADEGEILEGKPNPDIAYHQLIRPWKNRLSLFYIENNSFFVDVRIILFTAMALVSRARALREVKRLLFRLGAGADLVRVAGREDVLQPTPPPGALHIVESRG